MSDASFNDGVTGIVGISVVDGITKIGGVSIRRSSAGFINGYFTNDSLNNKYYTDDAFQNPYSYAD